VAGGCLQELNWYKQQYASWLVGDCVVQGELRGGHGGSAERRVEVLRAG